MSSLRLVLLLGSILVASTAAPHHAHAYYYYKCGDTILRFQSGGLEYEAGTNSFASPHRRHSLRQALIHWNDAPANFVFFEPEWNQGVNTNNNVSEVWYSTDGGILDGAPARALIKWNCTAFSKKFVAVDIVMNANRSWMNFEDRYNHQAWNGGYRPAQTTLMHELGHALGLAHENRRYNIMGSDPRVITLNNEKFRSYSSEDSSRGAAVVYGTTNSSKPDLAVSVFRYNGTSGEYSSHAFNRVVFAVTDTTVFSLPWKWDSVRQEHYVEVKRGQTYKFEFTYEHLGPGPNITTKAGYYLSTNTNITTLDWFLEDRNFLLGWNTPLTTLRTFQIPANAALQRYYFGVIIDYQNTTNERYGGNNQAYIAIQVTD
ncbi:MAG: hypothetical protein AAF436_17880 [Myxococcota bacterium]